MQLYIYVILNTLYYANTYDSSLKKARLVMKKILHTKNYTDF